MLPDENFRCEKDRAETKKFVTKKHGQKSEKDYLSTHEVCCIFADIPEAYEKRKKLLSKRKYILAEVHFRILKTYKLDSECIIRIRILITPAGE